MCSSNASLILFLLLKIIILLIIPLVILFYKRLNKKVLKLLFYLDIILIIIFIILRIFNNNCIVNSTISGIRINSLKNATDILKEEPDANDISKITIEADKSHRTYKNKDLYYYNQNREYMKNAYYMCNNQKIYMNSFGSSLTAFSTILSTIYNSNINPISLLNDYKQNNDICNNKITVNNLFSSIKINYPNIELVDIDSSQVENSIKNGNLVLVELSANEGSNFTCDNGYLIIYNIDLDGKYMIADPALSDNDLICPYSSKAYGRIIKSSNMSSSWYLSTIENEAVHYYLINITENYSSYNGQEMGHD